MSPKLWRRPAERVPGEEGAGAFLVAVMPLADVVAAASPHELALPLPGVVFPAAVVPGPVWPARGEPVRTQHVRRVCACVVSRVCM